MTHSRRAQLLERSRQRRDVLGASVPSFHVQQSEGLMSLQPGPRMPARRASQESTVSAFAQGQPSDALELVQQQQAHRSRSALEREPLSKNEEILALLDEWMKEPDDLGAEWWARFDEELKANRMNFPERDLP